MQPVPQKCMMIGQISSSKIYMNLLSLFGKHL
uniref:Uncharacterized protein n=1 Tax=Anguilla anguilla TaxID=7936 RepID=A0A0E9QV86_ANGAN